MSVEAVQGPAETEAGSIDSQSGPSVLQRRGAGLECLLGFHANCLADSGTTRPVEGVRDGKSAYAETVKLESPVLVGEIPAQLKLARRFQVDDTAGEDDPEATIL